MFYKLALILTLLLTLGLADADAASPPRLPVCQNYGEVVEVSDLSVILNVSEAEPATEQPQYLDDEPESCNLTDLPKVIEYDLCGVSVEGLEVGVKVHATTQIIFTGGDIFPKPGKPPEPMIERNCIKSFQSQTMKMTK